MTRLKIICLAICLVIGFGAAAEAAGLGSIIANYGSQDGATPTVFEDEDRSVFLDPSSASGTNDWTARTGLPSVGDIALGWFTIDLIEVGNATVPPASIVNVAPVSDSDNGSMDTYRVEGLLHGKVKSVNTVGGTTTISLENYTSATPTYYDGCLRWWDHHPAVSGQVGPQ